MSSYLVAFSSRPPNAERALIAEKHFRLDEEGLCVALGRNLSTRVRDLLRIAMAIYVVDRLCRRNHRSAKRGPKRHIDLTVQVSEPDFWRGQPLGVLRRACELLSDDRWDIRFVATPPQERCTQPCLDFGIPGSPVVCLYSGGLDSAAGLAMQLRTRRGKTLVVTAYHQAGQRTRVLRHLSWLRARYGRELHPAIARTTLIAPPRPSKQELTQPCRSLLFAALGGAAACACEAAKVEVYENGAGVINLPLMTGMQVGGRSSKSCHPVFLRHMTSLLSLVAERTITFELPFRSRTKAEVVQALAEDGLGQLARDTVSCVHYPMREQGPAKQCGVCAACIGRRQALIKAGVEEPSAGYLHDILGSQSALAAVPNGKLDFLLATMWQVDLLGELRPGERLPDLVRRQLYGTGILKTGECAEEWVEVLVRYREEWLDLIAAARSRGLSWGNWLGASETVA